MLNEYVTIIAALGGTTLGFILSEVREIFRKREKRKSVRSLIALEINQNLRSLERLLNELTENGMNFENKSRLTKKLAAKPLIKWNYSMWRAQISLLAVSFDEKELKTIYDVYDSFEELTRTHYKLLKFINENIKKWELSQKDHLLNSIIFEDKAPKCWMDFEKISKNYLKMVIH